MKDMNQTLRVVNQLSSPTPPIILAMSLFVTQSQSLVKRRGNDLPEMTYPNNIQVTPKLRFGMT